jgi:pimeloyl-ACP methyl ester carboxylesterase
VGAWVRATPERPWRVAGPEGAPAIVFVHGTALSGATWNRQLAALSDTFRSVAVDLPGHGVAAGTPFTIDAGVDTVLRAIGAEAPDGRAIVCGLSLGGYVAMATAGRHRDRVAGLVLAGCSREPEGPWALLYRLFAWAVETLPFDDIARVYVRVMALLTRRPAPPKPATAPPRDDELRWFPRGGARAARTLPGAGRRFRHWLEAYGGPILVLNGDLDLVMRASERGFVRGLPHVRRVVFRATGHLVNVERPAAFSAAVRSFATDVATDRAMGSGPPAPREPAD